jgi:hypothetical protein
MSDFLGMSDEDFLKQNAPEAAPEGAAASTEGNIQATETPATVEGDGEDSTAEGTVAATTEAETSAEDTTTQPNEDEPKADLPGSTTPETTEPKTEEPKTAAPGDQVKPPQGETQEAKPTEAPDYEGFYKQIMAPFKANGKQIELKSPAEAIQLMQMGANYTAKMQALVPHRKVLLMLENNQLLDESKLSFLIDLQNKNPEAIKKLIKDSGIDPMEIDTSVEPAYREGNHRVTDEEAKFRTALDDLKSNPTGTETLKVINTDWDQASKDVLWGSPEVMQIIHQQREVGIYDRIAAEIDRQKTLGRISPETPFLQAYKTVGDQLVEANAFADLVDKSTPPAPQPTVVATRVAAPKPTVSNSDKAIAASPTRTTPKTAKAVINPLAMSDDDFLKQMNGRV